MALDKKQNRGQKWFERFNIVVVDPKTLTTRRTFTTNRFRLIALAVGSLLMTSLLAVILVTQTRLLKLFGNRPQSFIAEDYKMLAEKLDTLQKLSEVRERQLEAMRKVITAGVANMPSEKQTDIEVEKSAPISMLNTLTESAPGPIVQYALPVDGEITAGFNEKKLHFGIDLVAKAKSQIKSILEGTVIFSRFTLDNGYTIWITHANGLMSAYMHNDQLLVFEGQQVQKGEAIAIIGNTGESSTGPHLHLELLKNGQYINPEIVLPFKKQKK